MIEGLLREAKLAHSQGLLADAEAAYRAVLAATPDQAEARFNLGVLLLREGRYSEGWPLYEARFAAGLKEPAPVRSSNFAHGRWTGQSLVGRSLLLWPEQGFGDYIQMARYAPLLKKAGLAKLSLVCAPPLAALLAGVEGVDAVLTESMDAHDHWLPIMSLPLRFGTTLGTIPAALPYVFPDEAQVNRWKKSVACDGLKVGLMWRGSAVNSLDADRSLPGLGSLQRLWDVPNVRFFSLQKGDAENEAVHSPLPIVPLGARTTDFADAAASIASMDLVICVDTAYAHLAGAMGKRCWVLVHSHPAEWRWLEDRGDSPWYPGVMRLFRKGVAPTWDGAIADMTQALRALSVQT